MSAARDAGSFLSFSRPVALVRHARSEKLGEIGGQVGIEEVLELLREFRADSLDIARGLFRTAPMTSRLIAMPAVRILRQVRAHSARLGRPKARISL